MVVRGTTTESHLVGGKWDRKGFSLKTALFGILRILFPEMAFLGNRGVKPLLQFIMPFLNS